jgi:hypothetical protein
MKISVRRFILAQAGGLTARIETTLCPWCTDEAFCSACAAKADRASASLARTAAKRDARRSAQRLAAKDSLIKPTVKQYECHQSQSKPRADESPEFCVE